MIQQEFCQDCHQKHDCQEVYRRLGHAECPSVALKVIVVFLVPMLIFVVSLAVFEVFFADAAGGILSSSLGGDSVSIHKLQTLLGFFSALSITFICILITKALNKRFRLI